MPDSDMLDTWMLFSDLCYHSFQAIRECISLSLKLNPTMLKLTITSIVDRLPVVINNEVGYVDVIFCKCCHCLENFLFSESLSKSIPSAYHLISSIFRVRWISTYSKLNHRTNSQPNVSLTRHLLS